MCETYHSEEAEDEQVHGGGDNCQSEDDVHDGESHVVILSQGVSLLKSHEIAKTDRRQSYDAVVNRVEVTPLFHISGCCEEGGRVGVA